MEEAAKSDLALRLQSAGVYPCISRQLCTDACMQTAAMLPTVDLDLQRSTKLSATPFVLQLLNGGSSSFSPHRLVLHPR